MTCLSCQNFKYCKNENGETRFCHKDIAHNAVEEVCDFADFEHILPSSARLYPVQEHDVFTTDVTTPPLGLSVIPRRLVTYYKKKWYNPFSWFKKYYAVEYEKVDIKEGEKI